MIKIRFISLIIAILATVMTIGGCAERTTPAPPPAALELPVVLGKQGIDLSSYRKIGLDDSHIEVSSINQDTEGKENLIKGLGAPFWHVKYPKETDDAWVVVDLGSEARLDILAIRPRTGFLDQIWRGDAAILEGSNNKEEWMLQVKLELKLEELNDQDWIAFVIPDNIGSYRYYCLFITDPGFLSLGGLAVYGEGGIPVVKPE